MFDIITIGSATRDVFLESNDFYDIKSSEFSSGVGECLSLGSKNEVQRIFFTTGGGATNVAVTFARLGLRVACLARVGNDDAGEEIIKVLRRENVDTRFIQKDSRDQTAYSTLLMHGPGERTILVYRGASERLSLDPYLFPPPACRGRIKEGAASWFYVTSLGGNLDLIKKIWSFARANKIKIAWNPGGEELKLGWTKLLPFIKQCEVFNVNREEASRLLLETESQRTPFKNLCGFARITLITDGARGAHACARQEPEARVGPEAPGALRAQLAAPQAQHKEFFVSSLGTKARNTTGAGDAFGSGFVAGLEIGSQQKRDPISVITYALRLAILNADSVIRNMGAKAGILKKMPSKKEFDKVKITSYKS